MKLIKHLISITVIALFTGVFAYAQTTETPKNVKFDAELAKKLGADKYGMKTYVLAILKTGPKDVEIKGKERRELFKGHMANMNRLVAEGKLAVAGPFAKNDKGFRGLFILNVTTIEEAKKLTDTDPVVKAGMMVVEHVLWHGSAALMETNSIHEKIAKEDFNSPRAMKVDLIIANAGQLVTCASQGKAKRGLAMRDVGIINNGALAISGGKITAVGQSDEILREFDAEDVIDADGRVVCPGFVDPHTHIVYAGNRLDEFELKIKGADYLKILADGGGIISTVRQTREASQEQLAEQSGKRLNKMLACGTTTVEIKTGYGLDTESELKMLDVIAELERTHAVDIVPTFLAAHAIPPEFKQNPGGYVDLICHEMLTEAWKWFENSRFRGKSPFFADVFCEKNAFGLRQTSQILKIAKKLGFALKAHVDEFTNLGGSRLAIELGAVSIDHLDTISDEEVKLLAQSETVGIVTPAVNFNFGSCGFADARKLIDYGCAVALSTDYNPGSAPCSSQPMAMAIACRYQKLLPSEALNAATINAAFGIGLGKSVGSLEAGKRADILVLHAKDYRELAYEFGGNCIKMVIKKGEPTISEKSAL